MTSGLLDQRRGFYNNNNTFVFDAEAKLGPVVVLS